MRRDMEMDDTHLCLRCSRTIIGLENYVLHRKQYCGPSIQPVVSLLQDDISLAEQNKDFHSLGGISDQFSNESLIFDTSADVHMRRSSMEGLNSLSCSNSFEFPQPKEVEALSDASLCIQTSFAGETSGYGLEHMNNSLTSGNETPKRIDEPQAVPLPKPQGIFQSQSGLFHKRLSSDSTSYIFNQTFPENRRNSSEDNLLSQELPNSNELTASDFFSYLELQSNISAPKIDPGPPLLHPCSSIGFDNQKCLKLSRENIYSLECELPPPTLSIIDDSAVVDMDALELQCKKWEANFKLQNDVFQDPASIKNNENATQKLSNESSFDNFMQCSSPSGEGNDIFKGTRNSSKRNSIGVVKGTELYQCSLCEEKYAFQFSFADHVLLCSTKHRNHKWLFQNERLLVSSSKFHCVLCSFITNDSYHFYDHIKSSNHCHKGAKLKYPLICLPCQFECSASDELIEHFSKVHLKQSSFIHPILIAETKRNLSCSYCSLVYENIKDYLHLYFEHNESHDVSCDKLSCFGISLSALNVCSFGFNINFTKSQRKVLNLMCDSSPHLNLGNPKFKSMLTAKENTEKVKKRHINGRKPYKCSKNSAKLSKSSQKSGGTQDCDNFNSHAKLSQHKQNQMRYHLYLCDNCGYAGKTAHELKKHQRSHTGEKPFKCDLCSYSASLSSQLLRHKRLHTGLKPYKCPHCKYSCNTQENLRKHILQTKKHKGKMMYPCRHCKFCSNSFQDFKSHVIHEHSKQFQDSKISSSAVAGVYEKCA